VRRCPDAVFLPVDRNAYEETSAEVMSALREFDAVVEVVGWDEAFLAVETDDPESVARQIQQRVRERTGLECSVGIGDNKLQAKLATGFGKPAGVFRLTGDNWFAVLGDQPTDALWGIGGKTAKRLATLGIGTVAELAAADPTKLAMRVGPTTGPWLVRLARGQDDSPVTGAPYVARSQSREVTFQQDIADWDDVRGEVGRLARALAADLVANRTGLAANRAVDTAAEGAADSAAEVVSEQRLVGRIVVKVRFVPFITRTHSHPLNPPTIAAADIEDAALAALDRFTERRAVRLVGVRAEFARGAHVSPRG
jgi:DNA polymerase-4